MDVSEFLVANNIRIRMKMNRLQKHVNKMMLGKRILQIFLSLSPNSLLGPIATTLKMQFRNARSRGDHASQTN